MTEAMSMVKFVCDNYKQSKQKEKMTEASISDFLLLATAMSG